MTVRDRFDPISRRGPVGWWAVADSWIAGCLPADVAPSTCGLCGLPIWCPPWLLYALHNGTHVHFRCKYRAEQLRWRWSR